MSSILFNSSLVRPTDDFNQLSGGMLLGRGRSFILFEKETDGERFLVTSAVFPALLVDDDRALLVEEDSFSSLRLDLLPDLSLGDDDLDRFDVA